MTSNMALRLLTLIPLCLFGGALLVLPGCGGEEDPGGEATVKEGVAAPADTGTTAGQIVFTGTVRHSSTGEPITQFRARLIDCGPQGGTAPRAIEKAFDNPDGSFRFVPSRSGKHKLYVKARNFIPRYLHNIEIPAGSSLTGYEITMAPGLHFAGSVVDDATGKPISGAIVGDLHALRNTPAPDRDWIFDQDRRTDQEGRFFINGLANRAFTLIVIHPDYAEASLSAAPDGEEIQFRLEKGARITGTALDDSGQPAGGLMISFSADNIPYERSVLTDDTGAYRSPSLLPGRIAVAALDRQSGAGSAPRFTAETRHVDVSDEDLVVDFGPLPQHASWTGIFYDWRDKPVQAGTVTIQRLADDGSADPESAPLRVRVDGEGRFAVRKLLPGRYDVVLGFPGIPSITPVKWETLEIAGGKPLEKDIRIEGGVVEGTVLDGFTGKPLVGSKARVMVSIGSGEAERRYMLAVGRDARFALINAPAGTYLFQAAAPRRAKGMVKNVQIETGKVIENFEIEIPVHGELRIKYTDMNEFRGKKYGVRADTDDPDEAVPMGTHTVGNAAYWDMKINLKPGAWTVKVSFEDFGATEHAVEIKKLETTEVEVTGNDFVTEDG